VSAVPVNVTVTLRSGCTSTVAAVARLIPATAWETRSCGRGCKGHRGYAWAWAATASPRHWVLTRRSPSDPSDLAFFYCHVPEGRPVPLPVLIWLAGKRWPAGECLQQGKGRAGVDQHQVRLWHCFCRHTVLPVGAPGAAGCRRRPPGTTRREPFARHRRRAARGPGSTPGSCPPAPAISLPVATPAWSTSASPEARRLACLAAAPMSGAARDLGYAWSRWRRRHQARARWHRYHARLKAARVS